MSINLKSSAIVLLLLSSFACGDIGGVQFSGGKPTVIAFPVGCEKFEWQVNDFQIRTTIFRDVNTGLVTGVWIKSDVGTEWAHNDAVKKILPEWQLPFSRSILEATKMWKFEKTQAVNNDADVLDKTVGRDYVFRFIKSPEGEWKTQIMDNNGVVGDDLPSS